MKLPFVIVVLFGVCILEGSAFIRKGKKLTTDGQDSIPLPNLVPSVEAPKDKAVLIVQKQKEYESLNNHKELEFEETCKLKQGYVIEVLSVEEKEGKGQIITGRPAFAVLNKKTLALFENENVNALLKSIDIKYLKSPLAPKNWKGLFCFQLIKDNVVEKIRSSDSSKTNKDSTQTISSICAANQKQMDSWMNAISDFHNCVVKEISIDEESVDEPVYQKKIRVKLEEEKEAEVERVNDENEKDDMEEKQSKNEDQKEEKVIEEEVKEMQREYLRQKAHERRVKRKLEEERKRMESKTKKLEEEQKCLERALEAKAVAEEKQAETLIKYEEEKKIKKEMSEATKSVIEESKKEESLIEKHEKELIENQKKIQKEISNVLVQEVVQSEKFLDPKVCFSEEVADPLNVAKICVSIDSEYGKPLNLQKVDTCKQTFCPTCCEYHIGGSLVAQKLTCVSKCQTAREPKPIVKKDEYIAQASSKSKIE